MKRTQAAFKAVILAGGSGERFWPLSTSERPKQFLSFFGGKSLIRQTVARFGGLVAPRDLSVITSRALAPLTARELKELPRANIVGEPCRRDTAAAIALGVGLAGSDPETVVGFFPSDQLVVKTAAFRAALKQAIAAARATEAIVTIGITPTGPSTAFGYIDPRRGTFVEKPSAARARTYLKKGFLWNAGMFVARVRSFRKAIESLQPTLKPLLDLHAPTPRKLAAIYAKLKRISFDYAIMERYPSIKVIPADIGWDDVGGFGSFDRYYPHDGNGNVRVGRGTAVEAKDSILISTGARISVLGVRNLVVVTAGDEVLVADKSRLGEMKKLFAK